jgi:hypothetical protein
LLTEENLHAELGDIMAGHAPGREKPEEKILIWHRGLAPVADELILGWPREMPERPDGLPGLKRVYGVEFEEFKPLDAGGPLTIEALGNGDIDVGRLFTSQGVIAARLGRARGRQGAEPRTTSRSSASRTDRGR